MTCIGMDTVREVEASLHDHLCASLRLCSFLLWNPVTKSLRQAQATHERALHGRWSLMDCQSAEQPPVLLRIEGDFQALAPELSLGKMRRLKAFGWLRLLLESKGILGCMRSPPSQPLRHSSVLQPSRS